MDTNKMREQFEAAFPGHLAATGWSTKDIPMMLERDSSGEYCAARTQGAWWGWQASREAVMVELPWKVPVVKPSSKESAIKDAHFLSVSFYNLGIEKCKKQIEAAGLKVKS